MVRQTGVSERLLYYYEEHGLLGPTRLPSEYRVYTDADVRTVWRIRTLLAARLPTATMTLVFPCVRDDGPDPRPGEFRAGCGIFAGSALGSPRRSNPCRASQRLLEAVIAAGPAALQLY